METIFVPLALLAGGLLPIQASANAQLSRSVASPFAATTLQLLVGAAVLLLITTLAGSLAALAGLSDVPWWHAIGGLASALYVVSGILLFPRLGAVVTVGLFIAGQMLVSVALDTFGILGVAAQSFDIATAAGTGAVLLGIIAIVKGQTPVTNAPPVASLPGWVLLAFVAGAILPIQGAVNALLRADLDAPLAVGAVSFVVASAGMVLVFLLTAIATEMPKPQMRALPSMPWWGWLGGFVGAYYVVTVFMAIPEIGTAATVGLTILGQQLVSMFVDRYGLLRLPHRPISGLRFTGVGLLLAGVSLTLML
jgi:bacterial/archaeal transporter family-2 protein